MRTTLALTERILDLACSIQQIPAPTFHEEQRAVWLLDQFHQAGLSEAALDEAGNVLACLRGSGTASPLVVTAHLDTVFPAETPLVCQRSPDRIQGPGIGDNSLGLAALLGLVWLLQEQNLSLPGDLYLAATVGEEGLGDLHGMRGLVNHFTTGPWREQSIKAFIVVEGMGLGEVYHRGLGVRRYRITCTTPGGHSWVDYGKPSAVHRMASLVTQFTGLSLPRQPRCSLNVGVIHGGTSVNTIAAQAEIELDLRSESPAGLDHLVEQVTELVGKYIQPPVNFSMVEIGNRPAGQIPVDHPLVEMALETLASLDITPSAGIGSTDANIPLSQGLPAICLGLTRGNGAHTLGEYILTQPFLLGMETLVQLVNRVSASSLW